MNAAPSAAGRRLAEEADALPEPSEGGPPKPPPEPEWKQELNRRLAGYRERRKLGADAAPELPPLPERPAILDPDERPSPLPPPRRGRDEPRPPARADRTVRAELPPIIEDPDAVEDDRATTEPVRSQRRAMDELLAPLSLRAVAGLMDTTVVLVSLGLFLGVAETAFRAVGAQRPTLDAALLGGGFCILLTFYWVFYFRYFGRTAGMTWIGLRLLNFDAEPPSEVQRRNRVLAALLSGAALGVGFIWAAADDQRLCWHDRMSKTFVALDDPPTA